MTGANRSRGLELVTVLKRLSDLDPRPIVFHTFSNEGYHLFGETVRQISDVPANRDLRPLVKGAIVDSAPTAPIATYALPPRNKLTYQFAAILSRLSRAMHTLPVLPLVIP